MPDIIMFYNISKWEERAYSLRTLWTIQKVRLESYKRRVSVSPMNITEITIDLAPCVRY